jgi:hypothetical protein
MINRTLRYKKILFIHPGSINKPSYIHKALVNLKLNFETIYCSKYIDYYSRKKHTNSYKKIFEKLFFPSDPFGANKDIKKKIINNSYDLIIIQKNNILRPSTYSFIKKRNITILSFYDDNYLKLHNMSMYFIFSIKYFDFLITIHRDSFFNYYSSKFVNNTCKLYLDFPSINKEILNNIDKNIKKINDRILFIGIATHERYIIINNLSKKFKIDVYGAYWDRYKFLNHNVKVNYKTITGSNYFKILQRYKIVLPLPRKENSDLLNYKCAEILGINGLLIIEENILSKKIQMLFDNVYLYNSNEDLVKIISNLMVKQIDYKFRKNSLIFNKYNMFFESRIKRVIYN